MKNHIQPRNLSVEHNEYLARIEPIVRARLIRRGRSEAYIARYINDLPNEHFYIRVSSLFV